MTESSVTDCDWLSQSLKNKQLFFYFFYWLSWLRLWLNDFDVNFEYPFVILRSKPLEFSREPLGTAPGPAASWMWAPENTSSWLAWRATWARPGDGRRKLTVALRLATLDSVRRHKKQQQLSAAAACDRRRTTGRRRDWWKRAGWIMYVSAWLLLFHAI